MQRACVKQDTRAARSPVSGPMLLLLHGSSSQLDNCGGRPSFIAQPAAASQLSPLLTLSPHKDGYIVSSTSTHIHMSVAKMIRICYPKRYIMSTSPILYTLSIVAAVCTRLHPSTAGTILFLNWIIGAHISRQCSHTAPGARLPSPRPELPEVTHLTSPLTSSHQPQDACSLFLSTSAAGVIFSQLLLSKCLLIGFLCYNCIVSTIIIV